MGVIPRLSRSRADSPASKRDGSEHGKCFSSSTLLPSEVLYSLPLSGCHKRQVTAHTGTHPMLQVSQKACGNTVAPQKRDFPIPRLFILTQGHSGCSMQQRTKGKHFSRGPDSPFSVRPSAPLAHISQGIMRICRSASPFPPLWFPSFCSSR